jgi:MSHA biogenesis protein MshM
LIYLEHFGLREAPFSITPDTDFFYAPSHQAALNTLLVALRGGEGFLKITAEVGCGKTMLCRQLLRQLHGEFVTAYIPNPDMGANDLFRAVAQELGLTLPRRMSRYAMLEALREKLLALAVLARPVLLCIDEAQAIPLETVESLRLLSNLETEKRKLIQIVLLGQPELDTKLALPEVRQLLQRITFADGLSPLRADQVGEYLAHRLQRAGQRVRMTPTFTPEAVALVHRYSGGVPRMVNVVAHKCLMLAFGEVEQQVRAEHVRWSAGDTPAVKDPPVVTDGVMGVMGIMGRWARLAGRLPRRGRGQAEFRA